MNAAQPKAVTLAWRSPIDASLTVDGVELAPVLLGATIHLSADGIPRVVLDLEALCLDATVVGPHVELSEAAAAAVRAAGWAPVAEREVDR